MESKYSKLLETSKKDGISKIVVGAYVTNLEGNVLILQRSDNEFMGGYYELPSGGVENNESIEDALKREVFEETGLIVSEVGDFISSFDYKSENGKLSRQHNFFVRVTSTDEVTLSDEHQKYIWVSKEDSNMCNADDVTNRLIKNFFEKTIQH